MMGATLISVAFFILGATVQEPYGDPRPNVPRDATMPSAELLRMDLSGEVLQIDSVRKAIQIRTKSNPKPMGLLLDRECKIRCDKKQFGRKELKLEEVEAGYQVDMIVRRGDMHVIDIMVKKPKEKSD